MVNTGKHHTSAQCHIATTLITRIVACWRAGTPYPLRDLAGTEVTATQARENRQPVLTANDADAAALGEYAVGYAHTTSMCLVKVSTGIGTGMVINGQSYTEAGSAR